jgi:tRNA(adenine34) deaminase
MKLEPAFIEYLMDKALDQARLAYGAGEVPVGAVMAQRGEIIAAAHNEIESQHDATCHAEVLAMRRAAARLGDWRLSETILCVTLEPCTMCAGAIKLSRVSVVVFGAADEKLGAFGSLYDLSQDERIGLVPRVVSGIKTAECAALLQDFFRSKRKS